MNILNETIFFLENKKEYTHKERTLIRKNIKKKTKSAFDKVVKGLISGIEDINSI